MTKITEIEFFNWPSMRKEFKSYRALSRRKNWAGVVSVLVLSVLIYAIAFISLALTNGI